MHERYFDNAASTPLDPRVRDAMLPWLGTLAGNAHSIHEAGRAARAAVERARAQVAALIGAEAPEEVFFTSGATEALNTVIAAFPTVAISPFEHSAVRAPALASRAEVLANSRYSIAAPASDPSLVAVMAVNNETGAVLTPPGAKRLLVDATQAAGKVPCGLGDFAAISAHKFHGPQGAGALYIRDAILIQPLLRGGGQEAGQRAGTLNVAGIVGMGAAAEIARSEMDEGRIAAQAMREVVLEGIRAVSGHFVNDGPDQSPFILSASFEGVLGESVVVELDRMGFAISSGAACSSESAEPSPVLTALGYSRDRVRGAMRISFGRFNTLESAYALAQALVTAIHTVRNIRIRD